VYMRLQSVLFLDRPPPAMATSFITDSAGCQKGE